MPVTSSEARPITHRDIATPILTCEFVSKYSLKTYLYFTYKPEELVAILSIHTWEMTIQASNFVHVHNDEKRLQFPPKLTKKTRMYHK